jgi:hypothetical protein
MVQCCSFTCAAFVIQYILAWDGEKLAHHFTSVSLRVFSIQKFIQIAMKGVMSLCALHFSCTARNGKFLPQDMHEATTF